MTFPVPSTDLEPDAPTPQTFFRGSPHWSNPPASGEDLLGATEARLGIVFPDTLRALYLQQNGGGSDFAYSARQPDASLTPGDDQFDASWLWALPDYALLPLGDLISMSDLQATFDYDPDHSWSEHLPGADRLIRIGQQAWDIYLCLDYTGNQTSPGVVLFDDVMLGPGAGAPYAATWPDFETFFASLRRNVLTELDGELYRGNLPAGPRDRPA